MARLLEHIPVETTRLNQIMRLFAAIGLFIAGLQGLFGATVCTSNGDGNWSSKFTCAGAGTPRTYIIRAQDTITVDVAGTAAIDTIHVYGQLSFNNGRKVDMTNSGIILVYTGGTVEDGNGGSKFDFMTGTDVVGSFNVTGPAYAKNSTGGAFISGPLPVTWLDFSATPSGKNIHVEWSTASESNTKEFQLETGTDGNLWTPLKVFPAAGFSTVIKTYKYLHQNVPQGSHYYRVKQTDLDGSFSYSDFRNVIHETGAEIIFSPNPVTDVVYISGQGNLALRSVQILTLTAEKISHPAAVLNNKSLDISTLPAGMYLLQVQFENGLNKTVLLQKL